MLLALPLIDVAGYLLHRSLHVMPWLWFRRAHSDHHDVLYSWREFVKPSPYVSVGDFWRFLLAGSIAAAVGLAALPLRQAVPLIVELAAYGFVNQRLHDAFHVAGHPLRRYAWFRSMQRLHFLHHINPARNFGIFWFFADRLFKTHEEDPCRPRS